MPILGAPATTGGAGLPTYIVNKTAAYTAAPFELVQADASGGAFAVTLPSNPMAGALVTVRRMNLGAAVSVVPSGSGTINGDPNLVLASKYASAVFEHLGGDVWMTVGSSAAAPGVTYPFTRTWTEEGRFDGIAAWVGTNGNTTTYGNPAGYAGQGQYGSAYAYPGIEARLNGLIPKQWHTMTSSLQGYSTTGERAFDHDSSGSGVVHTQNDTGWWRCDFGFLVPTRTIQPTRIAISGRDSGDQHPRNFKVQGSNDASSTPTNWTDLLTVTGEGPSNNTYWSKAIVGAAAYRHLRIFQTGNNQSNAGYLVFGELEFWGTMA